MNECHTVTIIIPVKPGGSVLSLARLREVDYPADCLEVLVAEGRRPSRQRNRAAAQATGELLYFLDDDSLVSPHFIRQAVTHFDDSRVAVAGGPSLTPATDSPLQRAIGIALASPVGGGGARNRYRSVGAARPTSERELILCNLAFRRQVFLDFGGLDERLYPNEENELMDRLLAAGWRLIHDPELAVRRSQRPTWRAFCRQFFGYGRGRGEQTRIGGVRSWIDFAPALLLFYLLTVPVVSLPLYRLPAGGYFVLVLLAALVEAFRARLPVMFPRLCLIFPLLHLCYGVGILRGLVAPRFARNGTDEPEVAVRTVKALGGAWPAGAGNDREPAR